MRLARFMLTAAAALLMTAATGIADLAARYETEHVRVIASDASTAERLGERAEVVLARVSRAIMGPAAYPHRVEIVAHAGSVTYGDGPSGTARHAGRATLTAEADGTIRRRIDLLAPDGATARVLDSVLPHELCHVVTADWFGDAPCPLYLHEGLAQLAESGDRSDREAIAGAAAGSGEAFALEALEAIQTVPDADAEADLFYAQSYSLVAYLHRALGFEGFGAFLDEVKAGRSLIDAYNAARPAETEPATVDHVHASWSRDAFERAAAAAAARTAGQDAGR